MKPLLRLASLVAIVVCSATGIVRAEEQTATHRIVGISEPSREEDLRAVVKTISEVQLMKFDPESTEATFRYDVTKLISGYNPKKPPTEEAITKRLEDLLRAASNGTFALKPPATIPNDKMQKLDIKVGVLDCKGCRYGAYIVIAKLDGVERATVTRDVLTVWIDPAKTNREALEAALKKARVELPAP